MSRKAVVIFLAAVFVIGTIALSFVGGSPTGSAVEQAGDASTSGGGAGLNLDLKSLPRVVAVVNGTEISRELLIRSLSSLQNEMQRSGQKISKENLESMKQNMVKSIINTELLYQASGRKNVKVDEDSIMAQFAEIRSRFASEEEFNTALSHELYTQEELKSEIRKGKMINGLLEEDVYSRINVSEEDAREYYDTNLEQFKQPQTVKARHILIKLEQKAGQEAAKKAEEQMKMIVQKQNDGEKFEELAKLYSEGPSASGGGDLGYFPRGSMVKEFEEVAFSLKPGAVSDVVRTQFGLHLIKVDDVREAGTVEFGEIKAQVIDRLKSMERRKIMEKYIADLREKAEIKKLI